MAEPIPIWKDTFLEISENASPFSYSIECYIDDDRGNETIFNGKAWVAPDDDYIHIAINRIVQDYLKIDFPSLSAVRPQGGVTTVLNNDAVKTFSVYDENHSLVASYDFRLDWSYKDRDTLHDPNIREVINRHGTEGMYFFGGGVGSANTFTDISRVPTDIQVENYGAPDYRAVTYEGGYCGDGALYYLNRYGIWCSFLIEGNILRKDNYTRQSITKSYDNNTLDRGAMVYNNRITPTWELHTSYLKDSESKRLAFHLLSSNQVYFHDLKEDKIWPVVINDSVGEYKTVRNQGKRMVAYTITVTAAQAQHNLG